MFDRYANRHRPARTAIVCGIRIVLSAFVLALAGCGGDDDDPQPVPPVASYRLSGTVAHLDTGPVVISNGTETLTVPQGSFLFTFGRSLANGSAYSVQVISQPPGMDCTVTNPSGAVTGMDIGNVGLACNTVISQPLALDVTGFGSRATAGSRIYLPVTQVGTVPTTINAIVDTGSAGTLLRASDIFPSSMVSASGFVFPAGQTSMTYNGITVTNVVASRRYGTQSNTVTTVKGNLAFAQITFGSGTRATTAATPVLLIFEATVNGNPSATSLANLIGVNPALAPIAVEGSPGNATPTPCTPQSTGTCGLASAFRYFGYGSGVDKGFTLGNINFAPCEIATPGSCQVAPRLTIGVTAGTAASFKSVPLSGCNSLVLIGKSTEPVCSQVVRGVTVTSGNSSFTGPMIFDSGFPYTRLTVPEGMVFPNSLPLGSVVRVMPGTGFAYEYETGNGFARTDINRATDPDDYSNSGIIFFQNNTMLLDYSESVEGWRRGAG